MIKLVLGASIIINILFLSYGFEKQKLIIAALARFQPILS